MHWTSIGESTTRGLAGQKDGWRVYVNTGGGETQAPGRTLASTHLRPLGVNERTPRDPKAPKHSAKNWTRFLAELRRRIER